jgi:hypothetical protein
VSSADLTLSARWRSVARPLLIGGMVLLAAIVVAVVSGGPGSDRLDPAEPAPTGTRAVAQVLEDQGVDVVRVTTTDAVIDVVAGDAFSTTVLVTDPELLVAEQVDRLTASGADLVLVAPSEPERFARGVRATAVLGGEEREPRCRLGPAARAGIIDAEGLGYTADGGVECYGSADGSLVVQVRDGDRRVTVLGAPRILTNAGVDEEGHAALALGLLGADERLVWYLPSLGDIPETAEQTSFYDLVPDAVWWGLGQLLVALVLLAWWRGRRLGPVVTEPLPVVIRAAETTEGRARLYRRAQARDSAADAMRAATRSRLLAGLGLPTAAAPESVVDAVSSRTSRTPSEVGALLYGAAPVEDRALVHLVDQLDALEREVRRP